MATTRTPRVSEGSIPSCRFCFDGGSDDEPLVTPCRCTGTSAHVHARCLLKWQTWRILTTASSGGGTEERAKSLSCSVCKATYATAPPSMSELLTHVRGEGGASLAALLVPGTLLVRNVSQFDESSLANAPQWLRWVFNRKRAHWNKAVYLITKVVPGRGVGGTDVLVGVNLTARLEKATRNSRGDDDDDEEKPLEAEGLSTSDDDDEEEDDDDGEIEVNEEEKEEEEEENDDDEARGRPRRRLADAAAADDDEDATTSSASDGRDGEIADPALAAALSETEEVHASMSNDAAALLELEDDDETFGDLSLEMMPHVRRYVGGPVRRDKRVVLLVSSAAESTLSAPTIALPLDADVEGAGASAERAYVYHQRGSDAAEYVEEVLAEAVGDALNAAGDDDDDDAAGDGGGGGDDDDDEIVVPKVHVFNGHARWSRSQLMNEVARGDWGLCPATRRDLGAGWRVAGNAFWSTLFDSGRPIFAKVGE